ncbi:MAG: hypothetical protein A3D89_03450 [Planctomycetes bacterium RIFCSPHIGHO2_02_FULL_52_58]|nr:MAG: hypothetical protein A3D89_03450 [Planctomycetes bacterium RIFCSPHIGHO2_02_FULL_52_58]
MKDMGILSYLKNADSLARSGGTATPGESGWTTPRQRREGMTIFAECFNKNKVPAKRLDFPAGTPIFSEADTASEMYFIEAGVVRITRNVPEIHREISLALLGPEEFFGIISCAMVKSRRSADAKAVTDCTLWQIDRETFREAVTKSPEFARLVIQGLIKRLEELQVKMKNTTEQMAEFTQRMEDLSTIWSSLVTWG